MEAGMMVHEALGLVRPGWGVGQVRLGMTRDQVVAVAGQPILEVDHDADGDTMLCYPGEARLYFYADREYRLALILMEDASALMLTAQPRQAITEAAALNWLGDSDYQTDATEYGGPDGRLMLERAHFAPTTGITLYCDGAETLRGVAVSVIVAATDELMWP